MKFRLLCVLAVSLISVGCSSRGTKEDAAAGGAGANGVITQGGTAEARDTADRKLSAALIANSGLAKAFYFEFDSTDIKAQDLQTIEKWGGLLKANPLAKIRLEGHADERGTPEYNLGLGERRGNAVRDALLARGATAAQISVISYGESRPVDTGHSPMAWNLNRRVEIAEIN